MTKVATSILVLLAIWSRVSASMARFALVSASPSVMVVVSSPTRTVTDTPVKDSTYDSTMLRAAASACSIVRADGAVVDVDVSGWPDSAVSDVHAVSPSTSPSTPRALAARWPETATSPGSSTQYAAATGRAALALVQGEC